LAIFLAVAQVAQAANIEAGKDLAAAVCAACHGANGVSVSDALPNLARRSEPPGIVNLSRGGMLLRSVARRLGAGKSLARL
jgi:mono/diheme cytochrome c family protein